MPQYIYDSSYFIEFLLLFFLIISLSKIYRFATLMVVITLLRPNERFDLILPYAKVTFVFLMISFLLNISFFKSFSLKGDNKIILLLVAYIVTQTLAFHSYNLEDNLTICIVGLLKYYFLIAVFSVNDFKSWFYKAIFISTLIILFEPMYYHFFQPENSELWQIFHGETGRIRAWGMWENANETSFLANTGIASVLLLISGNKQKYISFLLYFLGVIFLFIVIALTASRTGLACFFIMILAMMLSIKNKKIKFGIIFLLTILILLSPILITQRNESEMEGSSLERADLRYQGIQMFKQYPIFGVGFNRAQHDAGGMVLHNTYIQAFAELGIIGGALLFFFFLTIFKKTIKFRSELKNKGIMTPNNVILGIMLSFLFYFLFGNQLLSVMFFMTMALVKVTISNNDFSLESKLDQ